MQECKPSAVVVSSDYQLAKQVASVLAGDKIEEKVAIMNWTQIDNDDVAVSHLCLDDSFDPNDPILFRVLNKLCPVRTSFFRKGWLEQVHNHSKFLTEPTKSNHSPVNTSGLSN